MDIPIKRTARWIHSATRKDPCGELDSVFAVFIKCVLHVSRKGGSNPFVGLLGSYNTRERKLCWCFGKLVLLPEAVLRGSCVCCYALLDSERNNVLPCHARIRVAQTPNNSHRLQRGGLLPVVVIGGRVRFAFITLFWSGCCRWCNRCRCFHYGCRSFHYGCRRCYGCRGGCRCFQFGQAVFLRKVQSRLHCRVTLFTTGAGCVKWLDHLFHFLNRGGCLGLGGCLSWCGCCRCCFFDRGGCGFLNRCRCRFFGGCLGLGGCCFGGCFCCWCFFHCGVFCVFLMPRCYLRSGATLTDKNSRATQNCIYFCTPAKGIFYMCARKVCRRRLQLLLRSFLCCFYRRWKNPWDHQLAELYL